MKKYKLIFSVHTGYGELSAVHYGLVKISKVLTKRQVGWMAIYVALKA